MVLMYKLFFAISATVVPIMLRYWIKKRYKNKTEKLQLLSRQLGDSYYHCIFWTLENKNCRKHVYINKECGDKCSVTYLHTILQLLTSAQKSVSLCMYHLTLKSVTEELIKAQERGVNVRIITDYVTSKMAHSKMKLLKEKFGFDVRVPISRQSYMHHKFCVIDGKDPNLQKMFLGSLNLTLQGCVSNFEFVVITNNPQIICQYDNEFDLLWTTLDPKTQF